MCVVYIKALFLKKEVCKTNDTSWFEESGFYQHVKVLLMLMNIGGN